jgi:hypothetical protein
LETLIFIIPALLSLTLLLALAAKGLIRAYPVFFAYWVFDLTCQILLLSLPGRFTTYYYVWLGTSILRWIAQFLIVMELVDRILVDHPGVARVGKRVVQAALAISFAVSVWLMRFDWRAHRAPAVPSYYWSLEVDRVVSGFNLIFMIVLCSLLWRFPIRLSRNDTVYCFGFGLYFLIKTACFMVVNIRGPAAVDQSNRLFIASLAICQLFWILALNKRGIDRAPAFERSWTAEEQQRLIATLNGFTGQLSHRD